MVDVEGLLAEVNQNGAQAKELRENFQTNDPGARATLSVSFQLAALTAVLVAGVAVKETARVERPEIADGWYRIELMGHRRRHGYVTTATLSGRQMVEIRQPVASVDAAGDLTGEYTECVEHYAAAAVFSLSGSSQDDALEDARTFDSRHSAAGFPDCVFVRAPRMLLVEFKSERGELSDAQRQWALELGLVADRCEIADDAALVAYRLWRPEHWTSGVIEDELRRRPFA